MMLSKLDKLRPREKIMLGLAAVMVFVVVADQFVVKPLLESLSAMDVDIEKAKAGVVGNLRILQGEQATEAEYRQIEGAIGQAASPSEAIGQMKSEIGDLVTQAGLTLVSMNHREPVKQGVYEEYLADVGVKGGMAQILGFLDAVDQASSPGMLMVTRVALSPAREGDLVEGGMLLTKVVAAAVR